MADSNRLQGLQRFQNSQTLLSLSKHRLAMGDARFDQRCRLRGFSLHPARASLKAGSEITITQCARVVRPRENLEKCRQRIPGLLPVHRHRACGIRDHTGSPGTKKPPHMGGRVMGISTAYPNEPVIAGLLKKWRQPGLPKFSTFLWISCRQTVFCEIQSTRSGTSAART